MTTSASASTASLRPEDIAARYGRLVSSVCWRMTRDEDAAREAAQEVWVAVLEGLPGFRGESSLSTWIFAIARRVVGRYEAARRTYSVRFLSEYFEGEGEPEPPTDDADHAAWVRSMCDRCLCGMLQCLEPDVRFAYLLRDLADASYDDVADVLGVTPQAARQTVSRSRRKLRRFMRGHCSLSDPSGPCRCRMRNQVAALDLPAEYARLRSTVGRVRLFRESEQVLPHLDYWLELSHGVA